MKSNFWTSFDFSRNRGTLATRQRSNNLASSPGRKFVLPVVRHYRGQQLKPIIQIPGREGREDREKIRSVPDFRVCPHFHTPPKSHTRLSNNNGHWPSAIPEYSKPDDSIRQWTVRVPDNALVKCTVGGKRRPNGGGGCKIGAAGWNPLRSPRLPPSCWKRGWWCPFTRPHVTSSRFSSRREWPLSLRKICFDSSSSSLPDRSGTRRERLRMIYVANREFGARDAGHFLQARCFLEIFFVVVSLFFFSIVRLILSFTG